MYNYYLRRKALDEQHVRRQNPATYTEPLPTGSFMEEFAVEKKEEEEQMDDFSFYQKEQSKYPDLKLHFEKLVPSQVSYEEFWRRYEYRTDLNRIMEEMKKNDPTEVVKKKEAGVSLRRKIFKTLNLNDDEEEENPVTSDSSEPDEQQEENNNEKSRSLQQTEDEDDPVLEEIGSASSESDYSYDDDDLYDGVEENNIHHSVYPDKLEDDNVVVELDDPMDNLELSASEFDADAVEGLGEMEPSSQGVHMYPDNISDIKDDEVSGGAVDPVAKITMVDRMEDRILDDEYGSLDYNSEFGSLGAITDQGDTVDEDLKMLEEIYDEDDFIDDAYQDDDQAGDKADKCECACVIS